MTKKKSTKKKTANKKPVEKKTAKKRIGRQVGPVTEVTKSRNIKDTVRWLLWGKAAGRCEFSGCNRTLWKSPVTQEIVNIAEAAHIYAFSSDGPRGNAGIDKDELNEVDNLMLACHDCHQKMDKKKDGGRYTVDLLRQWKAEHERRVEIVAGIDPKKSSHVVVFEAPIGEHSSPLVFDEAAHALFPDYYPAEPRPIDLGATNSSFEDKSPEYWDVMSQVLQTHFDRKVKQQIETGEINHVSVFGLAPQPLLILLGTLLVDIAPAQIYCRYREPKPTWDWPTAEATLQLEVRRPDRCDGNPALVLGLTATVTDNRVTSALEDACIWTVTTPQPRHDHVRSPADLSMFRSEVRKLLDEIKERHGQETSLHIFPAAGNAVSIEFGRIRMPKAMMAWILYDQVNKRGGFVPVLGIY